MTNHLSRLLSALMAFGAEWAEADKLPTRAPERSETSNEQMVG
jgi:hypothetical protein